MAAAAVQTPFTSESFRSINKTEFQPQLAQKAAWQTVPKHDVETTLNYFKANEDGSPPHPTYVDRPETYDRPVEPHTVTVKDLAGEEDQYTLDKNGFQFHKQSAAEKDFLDEEHIKAVYYPETEKLLKEV